MNKIYVLMQKENDWDTSAKVHGVTLDIRKAESWIRFSKLTYIYEETISDRIRAYAEKKLAEIHTKGWDTEVADGDYRRWYEEHNPA